MESECNISDFYEYLFRFCENVNEHSRTNYMAWLSFLSKSYNISSNLDDDKIDEIIEIENVKRLDRDKYKTKKDMSNFRSTLNKYKEFVNFNFESKKLELIDNKIKDVKYNATLTITEKESILKSRVGQGDFRKKLILYWHGCAVSKIAKCDILIASHIKPWRYSSNVERLDVFNGLLLLPNYDKLFDKGYISFDLNGKILFSRFIDSDDKNLLGMSDDIRLQRVDEQHKKYLKYHQENCFMR